MILVSLFLLLNRKLETSTDEGLQKSIERRITFGKKIYYLNVVFIK